MWAGTAGSGPCANSTSGSEGISGAGYTASYSYDNLDRITSASVVDGSGSALADAAQGTYTYGDSAHLHAVTGVTSGGTATYGASYDAAGDLLCRAISSATTCSGGPQNGQQLSYDALRRLIGWQNAPGSSPTASEQYAYDGEGNRVWQQATSVSGSTTTTTDIAYALGTDETTTTTITGQQPTTSDTRSYPLPGGELAQRDGSGLFYLATDQLGTPIAALRLDDGVLVGT